MPYLSAVNPGEEWDFTANAVELNALLPKLRQHDHLVITPADEGAGVALGGHPVSGLPAHRQPAIERLFTGTVEPIDGDCPQLSLFQLKKIAALTPAGRGAERSSLVLARPAGRKAGSQYVITVADHTRLLLTPRVAGQDKVGELQLRETWASWC